MISPVDMTNTVRSSAPSPASVMDHEPTAMQNPPPAIWPRSNLVSGVTAVICPTFAYQTHAWLLSQNQRRLRTKATLTRLVLVRPEPDHAMLPTVDPLYTCGVSTPFTKNRRSE